MKTKITPASDYGHSAGYVIEELTWLIGETKPFYAIPAWEERGLSHLAGVFPTRQDAINALNE